MFALRRSALTVARSAVTSPVVVARRSISTLEPLLYTATGTTTGSRAAGHSTTASGSVDLKMQMPKEMGGQAHKQGVSDPEELFGLAYSTCFLSALNAVHSNTSPKLKALGKDTAVRAKISIGKDASGAREGFLLAVRLEIPSGPLKAAGLDHAGQEDLIKKAHDMCPYSRAIHGNVEVEVALVEA